jgi:hypothetical protein
LAPAKRPDEDDLLEGLSVLPANKSTRIDERRK